MSMQMLFAYGIAIFNKAALFSSKYIISDTPIMISVTILMLFWQYQFILAMLQISDTNQYFDEII